RARLAGRTEDVHGLRRAASADADWTRDPRVLSLHAAEDQRRAPRAPDLCVRDAPGGADHRAGAAGDLAEVAGEFLAAGARDQIQVRSGSADLPRQPGPHALR